MKVGIFLYNSDPQSGGVFTFEQEVFNAFLPMADESRHSFVVYTAGQKRTFPAKHIECVSIRRTFAPRVISKFYETSVSAIRKIRHPGTPFYVRNPVEKSLADYGVEAIWYLGHNSFFLEIPYIITVWDLEHRGHPFYPEVSEKGLWASRERHFSTAIRRAAVVITGSETGKKEIERYYQVPPERIRVIPLPTPGFALNPEKTKDNHILAEYRIPGGYLFYPAQFWPHKNHVGILKAVRLLKDKNISLPVVFVGSDKGNRQYIQKMAASLDLSSQVHFLGFVPTDVLIALYQHAFALVFPTFFGPDNVPPLEAFALGCPVIASNLAASKEQFGEAALLVDPKSPEQLALAVKSLYGDEGLRSHLVRCGFERAKRWTGSDYVRTIFSILDDFEPIRQSWGL